MMKRPLDARRCAVMMTIFAFATICIGMRPAEAQSDLVSRLAVATGYFDPPIDSRSFRSRPTPTPSQPRPARQMYAPPAVSDDLPMPSVLQGGPALYAEGESNMIDSDSYYNSQCYDNCCQEECYPCRWSLNLWIAGTDGRMNQDEEAGIAEGGSVRYFITDSLAAYAGIGFNHIDGDHQTLGTIGVERFASSCGSCWNRISAMAYWDKYDGALSDSTNQIRLRAGYLFTDYLEIGAVGTSGSGTARILPFGSNATAYVGSDYIGAYATIHTRFVDLCLMAGSSDGEGTGKNQGLYGLQARVPLTERLGVFAGYMYGDGNDDYYYNAGLEFTLGRKRDRRRY